MHFKQNIFLQHITHYTTGKALAIPYSLTRLSQKKKHLMINHNHLTTTSGTMIDELDHLPDDIPSLDLQKLKVISALGRGAKGVVFLVKTGCIDVEFVALKTILKANIVNRKGSGECDHDNIKSDDSRICFEQKALSCFQHPLLPKLRGVLSTDQLIGYAIDYCPGRDLNSLRKKQTEKMFSDDIIRFYAAELVLALEYLHGLGIVYRDLKPENVMIQENGHLMLVDFDLSTQLSGRTPEPSPMNMIKSVPNSLPNEKKRSFLTISRSRNSGISPDDMMNSGKPTSVSTSCNSNSVTKSNSFVGTEEYMAPEIIQGNGHDFSVDWWCFGVVLYEMLYGATPFRGINRKETYYRILTKTPELMGERTPLRDLIGNLLEKDPARRISLEKIKAHDFFKGIDWDLILQVQRPPFIPAAWSEDDDEDNYTIKEFTHIDVESFVQGVLVPDSEVKSGKNDGKNEITQEFLAF